MKTLGLDISTKSTGYSIIDTKNWKDNYVKLGIINPRNYDKWDNKPTKLEENELFDWSEYAMYKIDKLINKYNIKYIFIEGSLKNYASGRTSAEVVVQLITLNNLITYHLLKDKNLKVKRLHPSHARKVVTGKGRTKNYRNKRVSPSKRRACRFLIDMYGKKLRDDLPKMVRKVRFSKQAYDIVDSIIVNIAGIKENIISK